MTFTVDGHLRKRTLVLSRLYRSGKQEKVQVNCARACRGHLQQAAIDAV